MVAVQSDPKAKWDACKDDHFHRSQNLSQKKKKKSRGPGEWGLMASKYGVAF